MIDFKEILKDGEVWELFARDFLTEIGFYIESSVDRGPDGKKDLIISETLKGHLGKYKFKWLVSCKHYANSGNSVKETDEINIQERVESFNCDGFIGFYSTVPSSGLNTRLTNLKENGKIKDYRVFDYKRIENYLITIGYSKLLMRYFPESYRTIKPLHIIFDQYIPLNCNKCDADLLKKIYEDSYSGLIAFVEGNLEIEKNQISVEVVDDIYWSCKGICDHKLSDQFKISLKKFTSWKDIGDLMIPAYFIKWVISIMNNLEDENIKFSPKAYEKLKYFIMAISQKVMREMTVKENEEFKHLLKLDDWIF